MKYHNIIRIGDIVKFKTDTDFNLSDFPTISDSFHNIINNCIEKNYELKVRDIVYPNYSSFNYRDATKFKEYFPKGYAFLSYKDLVEEDNPDTPTTWISPYLVDIRLLEKIHDASEDEFYNLTDNTNPNYGRKVIITSDKDKLRKIIRENQSLNFARRRSNIDPYIDQIAGSVVKISYTPYAPDDYDIDWEYDDYGYTEFEVDPADEKYKYIGTMFYTKGSTASIISSDMIESFWYEGYEEPERDIIESCRRCGSDYTMTTTERTRLDEEDVNLCPECRKREYVAPYHRYAPKLDFKMTEEEKTCSSLNVSTESTLVPDIVRNNTKFNKFLGTEIEVAFGGEDNRNAAEAMSYMNYDKDNEFKEFNIYASHDSSIDRGFELITQPMTMNRHNELRKNYENMFKWLVSKGYRAHNSNCCGLHVHFSRNYFAENNGECDTTTEEANISKLLYIVEKYWSEIVLFSRRNYNSLVRYAKKIDKNPKDFIADWNKTDDHEGRYYSINLTNKDTIEFRMFKGTLNINTYFATLEFVDKLTTMVKEHTIEELQRMSFEEFLTPLALEYYNSRKNKFEEGGGSVEEVRQEIANYEATHNIDDVLNDDTSNWTVSF